MVQDGGKFNLWFKEADKDNDGLLSRSELKAKSLTDEVTFKTSYNHPFQDHF